MNNANIKFNWPLVGNEHISEYLTRNLLKNEASGVYIFSGPSNLGKTTAAKYFAKLLLCNGNSKTIVGDPCDNCPSCDIFKNKMFSPTDLSGLHADFHYIKKADDKKNISIGQVRGFIESLGMASFLNSYKIGIIKDAENLSIEAANALLKTLEEPKPNVVIILTVASIENLPATIISRSMILRFLPVKAGTIYDFLIKKYNIGRSAAKEFSRVCLGRPALAIKYLEDKKFYKTYADIISSLILSFYKDINERYAILDNLLAKLSGQELVKESEKIIALWQGIVRDLLLTHFGNADLIQNESISKELQKLSRNFTADRLLRIDSALARAKEYLSANVNPRSALESVILEI
jgi:DNA polymerase III subunit delta'